MMEALGRGEKALDTDFPEEDKFGPTCPGIERRGAGRRRS